NNVAYELLVFAERLLFAARSKRFEHFNVIPLFPGIHLELHHSESWSVPHVPSEREKDGLPIGDCPRDVNGLELSSRRFDHLFAHHFVRIRMRRNSVNLWRLDLPFIAALGWQAKKPLVRLKFLTIGGKAN